jgi:sulfur-carrier protein
MIKVRLFASIREAVGQAEIDVSAEGVRTVTELIAVLSRRGDAFRRALTAENLLIAVNQTMAERTVTIGDGDEVAFLPPVTGG